MSYNFTNQKDELTRDWFGILKMEMMKVEKGNLARLLYYQPVCLLSTPVSIMTISWLTPIDNHGHFIMSVNQKRHSLESILKEQQFMLNIPSLRHQQLCLAVGGVSGASGIDKYECLNLQKMDVGEYVGLRHMVANLCCKVVESREQFGHCILTCRIESATADQRYWNGKQLTSLPEDPILVFMGTKRFGAIQNI